MCTMSTKSRTRNDTTADSSSTCPRLMNKHKAKHPVVCLICDESIVDATSHTSGHAAFSAKGFVKNGSTPTVPTYQKWLSTLLLNSKTLSFGLNVVWIHKAESCCNLKQPLLNEELAAVKSQMSNSQQSPSTTTPPSSSTNPNQADSEAASEVSMTYLFTINTLNNTYPQVPYHNVPGKHPWPLAAQAP